MPICEKCRNKFPYRAFINGKKRSLTRRKFCLDCSPFGDHNTLNLSLNKVHNKDEKQCTKCKIVKPIKDYYIKREKGKKNRFCSICKECIKKLVQIHQRKKKLRAIRYLGGKCRECSFSKPQALVFHHRNGKKDKEFLWTEIRSKKWSTIKKEIDKCDLLCANCHLIHHAGDW